MFRDIYKKLVRYYKIISEINQIRGEVEVLRNEINIIKSRNDLPNDVLDLFLLARNSTEYAEAYKKENPLITICIATYNRCDLLLQRSLQSILNQTYSNFEVIIVGDCCTDSTQMLIEKLNDDRVLFVNLSERGNYPVDNHLRWMVAGTPPVNHALSIAKGDFITHLDDDDEFDSKRIEKLVHFIKYSQADLVWHPFWFEANDGEWSLNAAREFKRGQVTTSSVFYHNWFKNIPWDIDAYKYYEAGDWNRFRKIKYLGARLALFDEPLLKHYRERSQ